MIRLTVALFASLVAMAMVEAHPQYRTYNYDHNSHPEYKTYNDDNYSHNHNHNTPQAKVVVDTTYKTLCDAALGGCVKATDTQVSNTVKADHGFTADFAFKFDEGFTQMEFEVEASGRIDKELDAVLMCGRPGTDESTHLALAFLKLDLDKDDAKREKLVTADLQGNSCDGIIVKDLMTLYHMMRLDLVYVLISSHALNVNPRRNLRGYGNQQPVTPPAPAAVTSPTVTPGTLQLENVDFIRGQIFLFD